MLDRRKGRLRSAKRPPSHSFPRILPRRNLRRAAQVVSAPLCERSSGKSSSSFSAAASTAASALPEEAIPSSPGTSHHREASNERVEPQTASALRLPGEQAALFEQSKPDVARPPSRAESWLAPAEGCLTPSAQTAAMQPSWQPMTTESASMQGTAHDTQAFAAAQGPFRVDQGAAATKQAHAVRPAGTAAELPAKLAQETESGEIRSDRSEHAERDSEFEEEWTPVKAPGSPGELAYIWTVPPSPLSSYLK